MVNAMDAARTSALKDYGLTILPRMCVIDDIRKGNLKEISIDDISLEYSIYLIYTQENHKIIKNFIDYIKKESKKILI